MTRTPDLDRMLESFMEDGPRSIPTRALENALEQVEHTQQRPIAGVRAPRLVRSVGSLMPQWSSVAVVAAAALVIAVLLAEWGGLPIGDRQASPTPTVSPTPSATDSLPPATPIEPDAVIPVPAAYLALADGDRVWVSSDEELVAIDTATGDTSVIPVPIPRGSWAGLAALDGSIWVGNYDDGVVYRLDPDSGDIEAEIPVGSEAVSLTAAGGGIWVRTEGTVTWEAHRIDPDTNEVVTTVDGGNAIAAGHGSLWFAQRGADRIIRADPVTGETVAVIEVPREHDCAVFATSDAMWGSCLIPDRVVASVARIDPATNEVTTINTGGGVGGAFDAGGRTWLTATIPEGGAFLAVDPATNTVSEVLLVDPGFDADNAVIAGGSVWMANDAEHEVYRFGLDGFAGAE